MQEISRRRANSSTSECEMRASRSRRWLSCASTSKNRPSIPTLLRLKLRAGLLDQFTRTTHRHFVKTREESGSYTASRTPDSLSTCDRTRQRSRPTGDEEFTVSPQSIHSFSSHWPL